MKLKTQRQCPVQSALSWSSWSSSRPDTSLILMRLSKCWCWHTLNPCNGTAKGWQNVSYISVNNIHTQWSPNQDLQQETQQHLGAYWHKIWVEISDLNLLLWKKKQKNNDIRYKIFSISSETQPTQPNTPSDDSPLAGDTGQYMHTPQHWKTALWPDNPSPFHCNTQMHMNTHTRLVKFLEFWICSRFVRVWGFVLHL